MEISLKNKVAMITGASRGIGRAIALEMAKSGADIVLASRKIADLEKVATEIKACGVKALPIAAHIGRMEDITALVTQAVKEFGRIDILVNDAATNPTMDSAIDVSERAWDSIMNLNLKGLFFLSQSVARVMKEHGGGVIINVSSIAGVTPDILPIYSVSKAGVNMATKVMAQQWAGYGIRANTLSPGQTKTQFSQALWGNPEIYKYIMARTPLKRIAEPEDMARAAVFLASNEAGFITGQNLIVDGGMTI
ncbi:MAG: glucose 1-dehydrogenase [Dehalococcoidia bacterium]|jgi:NAD(P)-dependent dehydrogenase (short-subunit alcohol dehydrogenase family)